MALRMKWHRVTMPCGTVRHTLYAGDTRTPYFADDARGAGNGHRYNGYAVALFGAGMGSEVRCFNGTSSYRIAAFLQGFPALRPAKAEAEMRATAAPDLIGQHVHDLHTAPSGGRAHA